MDVQPNPRMAVLLERAEYVPGTENEEAWQRASLDNEPVRRVVAIRMRFAGYLAAETRRSLACPSWRRRCSL